jgi:uncharacterized protein YprB with RNaseH-like and TPR domain
MIECSFCFLPGVGLQTERHFWRLGIDTWSDFLTTSSIACIGRRRKLWYDEAVAHAQHHYQRQDSRFFAVTLHPREHWRLYEWLRPRAVYLDIETNAYGDITVVGLYGDGRFTSLVKGESLDRRRLCDELARYDLLVTFNGTTFDLPVLLANFEGLPLDQAHVDLCQVGRRLGYRGGLKSVERQLGIERAGPLRGMGGAEAVLLWNRWRHSRDQSARELLLAYNEADCVNLEPLADRFYCQLVQQRRGGPAYGLAARG